jgi:hypothetical protein
MNQLAAFLSLLAAHWLADFVLQTHWQAQNKSKSNVALFRHVLVYTAVLGAASAAIFGPSIGWLGFVWLNFALHFATDYCTSRLTSRLYTRGDWHNFFVVVGFDQLIHQATLAATMWWLLST